MSDNDVREKLVEIVKKAAYSSLPSNTEDFHLNMFVTNLLSHGVTVQEWISVDDRLPEIPEGWVESPEPVLYMMKNTKTIYAGYYGEGGVWRDKYFRQYADSRNGVDADDVLCWMYQHDLPQPPKGE